MAIAKKDREAIEAMLGNIRRRDPDGGEREHVEELFRLGRLGSVISRNDYRFMRASILAMAEFRLNGDVAEACRLLDGCGEAHQDSTRALQAAMVRPPEEIEQIGHRSVLFQSIRHLLRNDRQSLWELALLLEVPSNPVNECFGLFTVGLLGQAVGKDTTRLRDVSGVKHFGQMKPKYVLWGYDRLLETILAGDQEAFDAARAQVEAQYRARSRMREPQISEYGCNRLSQLCTFDAVGTALCRVAVWSGMRVEVDNEMYPRVFYAE